MNGLFIVTSGCKWHCQRLVWTIYIKTCVKNIYRWRGVYLGEGCLFKGGVFILGEGCLFKGGVYYIFDILHGIIPVYHVCEFEIVLNLNWILTFVTSFPLLWDENISDDPKVLQSAMAHAKLQHWLEQNTRLIYIYIYIQKNNINNHTPPNLFHKVKLCQSFYLLIYFYVLLLSSNTVN